MWYAITAGAGLLLGLGLMIWGLTERSKRHAAERAADAARAAEKAAVALADQNAVKAGVLDQRNTALDQQITVLRAGLAIAREKLAPGGDPAAVKEWLDGELEGGEV